MFFMYSSYEKYARKTEIMAQIGVECEEYLEIAKELNELDVFKSLGYTNLQIETFVFFSRNYREEAAGFTELEEKL